MWVALENAFCSTNRINFSNVLFAKEEEEEEEPVEMFSSHGHGAQTCSKLNIFDMTETCTNKQNLNTLAFVLK